MSGAEGVDPFDWSIDQVVAAIAPDDDEIAATFRFHEVNGRVLLTVCSYLRLKVDLKILPLGRREKIVTKITELRRKSERYMEHLRRENLLQLRLQPDARLHEAPMLPVASIKPLQLPGSVGFSAIPPEPEPPSPSCQSLLNPIPEFRLVDISSGPSAPLGLNSRNEPLLVADPFGILETGGTSATQVEQDSQPEANKERSQSPQIELSPPQIPLEYWGTVYPHEDVDMDDDETIAAESPIPKRSDDDERTTAGTPSLKITPNNKKRTIENARYLPLKGMTVDKIFYDEVRVGSEIGSEEEDDDFTIGPSEKLLGERLYMERQIRYFLRNPDTATVVHKRHLRTAIKPYKANLIQKHQHQSITLFDVQQDGSCRVYRTDESKINLPWNQEAREATKSSESQIVRFLDKPEHPQPELNLEDNSAHDWDYLLKWQNQPDDTILPVFADSGSEGEYDVALWREMEDELGPQRKLLGKSNQKPLSREEIEQAVAEGIRELQDKWKKDVLPKREKKAYGAWKLATKNKSRKGTIRGLIAKVEERRTRITNMQNEICGMVWTKKSAVRKQCCGSMEVTVADIEHMTWLISLLGSKNAPAKPPKAPRIIREDEDGDQEMVDSEDDDESIGSESSEDFDSDEDEGLDGFIVADSTKDMKDGMEIEVDGQQEVEEEMAKRAEVEVTESDSDSENSEASQAVTQRKRKRKRSILSEESFGDTENNAPMTGINDDDNDSDGGSDGDAEADSIIKVKAESQPNGRSRTTPKKINKNTPIIDLTLESPPESHPRRTRLIKRPQRSSLADIEHIEISDEEDEKSPSPTKRKEETKNEALMGALVADISQIMRENIWYRLETRADIFHTITIVARQLNSSRIRGVPGLDEHNALVYKTITKLYICWALGKIEATKLTARELETIDDRANFDAFVKSLSKALRGYIRRLEEVDVPPDPENLSGAQSRKTRKGKGRAEMSHGIDFGFDEIDDLIPESETQHRKRRRKEIAEDISARMQRERLSKVHKNIAARIRQQEKKKQANGVENDGRIAINLGHYSKHNDIFFHHWLAENLKPHQIDGIRFMWMQLVQTGEDRGALLAHTMGLGKTFQVIALLYTLATAAGSREKATVDQIPRHLRKSKTLILSPPGLIENWWDEFHMWLPQKTGDPSQLDLKDIGEIVRADSTIPPKERLQAIQTWFKEGGVLLMGYATFRNLIINFPRKIGDSKKVALSPEQHERVKKMLLEGPNIIIADEAHHLKNPESKISEAAKGFRSMSRIAMTGSPLSNNLLEYWTMIEWIDPGFLGDMKAFQHKYVDPIEDGLYADSSVPERRQCLKMLRVLKNDLGPKVHRADISVLKDDLPSKTEFLVRVPLTELQLDMYNKFISDPTTTGHANDVAAKSKNGTNFFDIIQLMSLICNHPLCFVKRVEDREAKNQLAVQRKKAMLEEEDHLSDYDLEPPQELNMELLDKANQPYSWAVDVLKTAKDPESWVHSYKMHALKLILEYSIAQRDQVLIFSHSIPTLDIIETFLEKWRMRYMRLDGTTKIVLRQAGTKKFNAGEGDVYLISTEAGGLGLNLPGANRVIIFDFKWTPMWEEQAVGRAYRMGQKKHVFVYRFFAGGTYEAQMRNRILFKNQLQSRVVDKKDPIRHATKNLKKYLKPPVVIPKEDLSEFKGKDLVLDKILEQVDFVHGIQYTETFQRDEDDVLTEEEQREADELLKEQQSQRTANTQRNILPAASAGALPVATTAAAAAAAAAAAGATPHRSFTPNTWETMERRRRAWDINGAGSSSSSLQRPNGSSPFVYPFVQRPSGSSPSVQRPNGSSPSVRESGGSSSPAQKSNVAPANNANPSPLSPESKRNRFGLNFSSQLPPVSRRFRRDGDGNGANSS